MVAPVFSLRENSITFTIDSLSIPEILPQKTIFLVADFILIKNSIGNSIFPVKQGITVKNTGIPVVKIRVSGHSFTLTIFIP
jgi:hypothetical protein